MGGMQPAQIPAHKTAVPTHAPAGRSGGSPGGQAGSAGQGATCGEFTPSPPLEKPIQYLRGVGPGRARLLAGLGVNTVGDLIEFFPFRYEDQGRPQPMDTLILDEPATVLGMVEQVRSRGGYVKPMVAATVVDGSGKLKATWFNAPYMVEKLARGQVVRLYGQVGVHDDTAQMVNPRIEWLDPNAGPEGSNYTRVTPVYHAALNLSSAQISKLVETALGEGLSAVRETLPEALRQGHQLPGRAEAVKAMHQPVTMDDVAPARRRLAYEELFQMQLAISLQRRWSRLRAKAPAMPTTAEIDARIRRRFPFTLTQAQDKVVGEIAADLAGERPMTRLLQGDVGSGKTVVALYAALVAIANRQQCAILAPTAVLAAQHAASIEKYLAGSRVNRCVLTGSTNATQRNQARVKIADGSMNLIVGTQALLESRVQFKSLGLVIVDEQHKFGVSQRAALRGKSKEPRAGTGAAASQHRRDAGATRSAGEPFGLNVPHYLVMTATPIPRTLSMTVFGDLDVSVIDALPPGARADRHAGGSAAGRTAGLAGDSPAHRRRRSGLRGLSAGRGIRPDRLAGRDRRSGARVAHELLPGTRVGLLHGRMKRPEKQAVMSRIRGR